MQPERVPIRVRSDRQHGGRLDALRRTAAVVRAVGVRHEEAQRVVAAAQVQHDEQPAAHTLGQCEIGQQSRGGEAQRERRHTVLEECSSCHTHRSILHEAHTN